MATADRLDGAIDAARMALLVRAPARHTSRALNRVDIVPHFETPENTKTRATACPPIHCLTAERHRVLEPSQNFIRPPLQLPRFNATRPQTEN